MKFYKTKYLTFIFRTVIFKLKNNHLVKSVRGPQEDTVRKKAKDIKLSSIIFAVDEEVKTLNCKKDSKKGCDGRSVNVLHTIFGMI